MFILSARRSLQIAIFSFVLSSPGLMAQTPQTPVQTPPTNPAQRDATRPPGTERNQPIPEPARPITQDPTAPPGAQRPAPQAPPGTNVTPIQPATPRQTAAPNQTARPTPSAQSPTSAEPSGIPADSSPVFQNDQVREPNIPAVKPLAVPPLPNLTRLGVTSDNTVSLSLNDAIRRALENNNDIEVARNDVRLAETTLRGLQGVYDPFFSITPQIDSRVQPQQSRIGGAGQSGTVSSTILTLSPSVTKLFSTGGGQYDFIFGNTRQTSNSTFNQLNPVYSANLGATFTQPLLRDRSIDNNRRQIRIQRKRLEQSDAEFRRRTIEAIAQVQRAYWDLVFALRDQENRIANLNLTRENFRRVEAQIAAGAAAPISRAEVQTEPD